jgi:membrane protease YdiL (CAAX protease family)
VNGADHKGEVTQGHDAPRRSPENAGAIAAFFLLAFALAWIFWVPAALLFRSEAHAQIPAGLVALQTLGAVAPSIAAVMVLRLTGRRDLVKAILDRYRLWRVGIGWYAAAILLTPGLTALSLSVTALVDPGFRVPADSPLGDMLSGGPIWVLVLTLPMQFAGMMFSSPLLEEYGWRGYALPALQERMAALPAAVVLGLLWGVWHLPLMVAYGQAVVPYLAVITAHSILAAWLVNATGGSMLIAMLFHASLNVSQTTLSIGRADWFAIILTWAVVVAVIAMHGPRHLGRRERITLPFGAVK